MRRTAGRGPRHLQADDSRHGREEDPEEKPAERHADGADSRAREHRHLAKNVSGLDREKGSVRERECVCVSERERENASMRVH